MGRIEQHNLKNMPDLLKLLLKKEGFPSRNIFQWYSCDNCHYKTKSWYLLLLHEQNCNSALKFQCTNTSLEEYKCPLCHFTTHFFVNLKHHSNQHLQKRRRKPYIAKIFQKSYNCKSCNFQTYSWLISCDHHDKALHMLQQAYFCEKCGFKTEVKQDFADHLTVHDDDREWMKCEKIIKLFNCEQCEYQGTDYSSLKKHQNGMHKENAKWYHCDQCDYKTKWKYHLKRHSNLHLPIEQKKILKCDFCDYKNIYNYNLKKHLIIHESEETTQWFKCEICSFKTKWEHSYKSHQIKQHQIDAQIKWFRCEQCDYKSKWKSNLNQHVVKHSKIKKFQCNQCDYQTLRSSSLSSHKRIHKGNVKCFECKKCNYKTQFLSSYSKHCLFHKSEKDCQLYVCDQCPLFKSKYRDNYYRHKKLFHAIKTDIVMKTI